MREDQNNLRAEPRAAISAPALPKDSPVCWNPRNVDIGGLRWIIRRVALEALEEMKREDESRRNAGTAGRS